MKAHFNLEGQLRFNPIFEKDINLLRTISPRFLIYLFSSDGVTADCAGTERDLPFLFVFLAGGLLLLEVFVHFRHVRNIVSFWYLSRNEGVAGQISYSALVFVPDLLD